jgi:UDP-N-acetylmuramoyl-tripeptide--D-alanyl-D-alanine ligase
VDRRRVQFWLRQVPIGWVVWRLQPLLYLVAWLWRRLLFRTTFIAITGSLGKTTAKECLAGILGSRYPTCRTYRNQNTFEFQILNLLRVRPWHRYAVLEMSAARPGGLERSARLVRPDVAVITSVLRTHTDVFADLDEHAAEKGKLLDALRPGGLAVLNADDPRVAGLARRAPGSVVLFGESPEAVVRAGEVSSKWPARLKFRIGSEIIETQLVGTHWLPTALGAVAAAHSLGMDLGEISRALRQVEPFPGRLLPMRLPNGATLLRDDYNASVDTVETSLQVLGDAEAPRRLLALTDMSDFGKNRKQRLKFLAPKIVRVTEVLILIGEIAAYGARRVVEAGMAPENVHAFATPREATDFLSGELRAGDLVLLKGRTTDHAARIYLGQLGPVGCWKPYCAKPMLCDICWECDITAKQLRRATVARAAHSAGSLRADGQAR